MRAKAFSRTSLAITCFMANYIRNFFFYNFVVMQLLLPPVISYYYLQK